MDTVENSNAIKYNHFHGTVNVHCEELSDDGNMAVFQFVCSDTGLGMSEEFQKHVFSKYIMHICIDFFIVDLPILFADDVLF